MSMNIGPMLRAMLGDAAPDEGSRALELRIGQIVRGVLLEMLGNGEGLISINGAHVRAKLEADLPLGRGTLLQVQPGSTGGVISLKPLADTSEMLPEEGLKDILKSFGLPDQKSSLDLLRGLKRDGYPIGKETASYFQNAGSLKPAGADMQSWLGAADVAFRRGLEASGDTLASLRQALFGRPLHEELTGISAALEGWRHSGGTPSTATAALATRLQNLLAEGAKLLAQGESQLLGEPAQAVSSPVVAEKQPAALGGRPSVPGTNEPGKSALSGAQALTAALIHPLTEPAAEGQRDLPFGRAAANVAPTGEPHPAMTPQSVVEPPDNERVRVAPSRAGQAPATVATAVAGAAPQTEAAWIGRFLEWLGAGHEHRLLNAAAAAGAAGGQADLAAAPLPPEGAGSSGSDKAHAAADSLKSALLSLAGNDEAPPALREAAQTLVSQITGQQLLLSSERQPNAPFTLMTLFVPMKGQDGDTTATVHVQTRRSRRGEWDTDNCRLLFDLRMRHLGETIVDVQVVDRIVSLKLMNDFPGMVNLADQAREELSSALGAAGFQLLSLTAQPLPVLRDMSGAESGDKAEKTDGKLASAFTAKPYKGVDFRV